MVEQRLFGTHEGREVKSFTLKNNSGMRVELISYGARIKDILVPDGKGNVADVNLGFNDLQGYIGDNASFGATVGRVANRIRGARFSLGEKEYTLAKNDGNNHLHGGKIGFAQRHWIGEPVENGVSFTLHSPDGEEGYPGNMLVNVTYRLNESNELSIAYMAVSDKDTPMCLTNHAYFNLAGEGDIYEHELMINASRYTRNDAECVPTGEILSVFGTPMDFTKPKPIGRDIHSDFEQLRLFGGFDHNYILDSSEAATVCEPKSGRRMYVRTDLPCMQFYSANSTSAQGKAKYGKHCSFCLETQFVPNAVNNPHLTGGVLRAGELFKSETVYGFGIGQ